MAEVVEVVAVVEVEVVGGGVGVGGGGGGGGGGLGVAVVEAVGGAMRGRAPLMSSGSFSLFLYTISSDSSFAPSFSS